MRPGVAGPATLGRMFTDLRRLTSYDTATRARLTDGALLPLAPEIAVDAVAYRKLPPWRRAEVRARAFGLAADRAVLCSLSAARVLGIEVLSWDDTVELGYVDSDRTPPKSQRAPRTRYYGSRVPRSEVLVVDGLRVTGVERTLVDIARRHGVVEGVVAIDSALRRFPGLSVQRLLAAGERLRVHGIAKYRRAVQLCDEKSESPKESQARALLHLAELPGVKKVRTQARITAGGRQIRVDLLLDEWLVIEVDGQVKYDGVTYGKPTDQVLREERQREKALQNLGYTVLRIGHAEMIPTADGSVPMVELVARALARRARRAVTP